jgi:SNF2 family DNA or RNA helicase
MTYTPVLKPYAHQVTALERAAGKKAFAWLMGMRTGKTKVTIDDWGRMVEAGEVGDLLVIAPAGAYRTWEGEIDKHLPVSIKERTAAATWISGSPRAGEIVGKVIRTLDAKQPRILLMNVEALSSTPLAKVAAAEFMVSGRERGVMVAVDESTTVKNKQAERTKTVWRIGNLARYRRILSGLPTPRSPLDLWGQMEFLDHSILNFVSYKAFEQRYADTRPMKVTGGKDEDGKRQGYYINVVKRYKNIDELSAKIAPHSFRVRLEDCADIPPKMYLFRDVELTSEQRRLYDEMKSQMTTRLASGEYASTTEVITQLLRLHQICCGHLVDEQGKLHDVPSNRLRDLVDLLEDYDGKAVIWCAYGHNLYAIQERLEKVFGDNAVAVFWGGNKGEREAEDERFRKHDKCRFMIATPASGGRGRTWDVANLMIFYSNTDNLEYRDQAEERASAVGKQAKVTIVDMRARGTVEDKIIMSLRKKIDIASQITGDAWREWVI